MATVETGKPLAGWSGRAAAVAAGGRTTAAHDPALDAARGVAIVMVVAGHAMAGVLAAGADARLLRFALVAVYAVHVPLLFLLSGRLAQGFARRPWRRAAGDLWVRVAWPYLLWSLVLLLAHHAMSGHTNVAVPEVAPWRILWRPPGVMWFLYVMVFALLALRLLAPLPRRAVAGVALGLVAVAYAMPDPPGLLFDGLRFTGLFLLAFALPATTWQPTPLGLAAALAVMGATLGLAWSWSAAPLEGGPARDLVFLPAAVAGPFMLLALTRGARAGGWLAAVGRQAMAIYVTHVFVTAGVRIGLGAAGVGGWAAPVLAGTLLGVVLPLAAARLAERAGVARVLGWRR